MNMIIIGPNLLLNLLMGHFLSCILNLPPDVRLGRALDDDDESKRHRHRAEAAARQLDPEEAVQPRQQVHNSIAKI